MKQLYTLSFHPHLQFSPHLQPLFNLGLNFNRFFLDTYLLTTKAATIHAEITLSNNAIRGLDPNVDIALWTFQNGMASDDISRIIQAVAPQLESRIFIISGFEELPIINDPNWTLLHQAKCLGRKDLHYFQHCRYWFTICSLDCTSPFTKPDYRNSGLDGEPWHLGRSLSTSSLPDTWGTLLIN